MRYVKSKYAKEQKDLAYRLYVTDSLFYQSDNKRLTVRYLDMITPKKIEKRSGEEIASDVINKLNLKWSDNNG